MVETIIVERLDAPVKVVRGIPKKWPPQASQYFKMMIGKGIEIGHEEN